MRSAHLVGVICRAAANAVSSAPAAPVAQLDRALPSEGRGQGFESLRVRQHPTDQSPILQCFPRFSESSRWKTSVGV